MSKHLHIMISTVLIILTACTPTATPTPLSTPTTPPMPTPGVPDRLHFGVLVTEPLLAWFNDTACAIDIASAKPPSIEILAHVKTARRQLVTPAVIEAEALVPILADDIDIIGYDLEGWPQTPEDEQADPVGAVMRLRALADEYGLEVSLGPSRSFAESHGVEMAPYADRFVIQLQKAQDNPQAALEYALPMIARLRQANPSIEVAVVLRPDAGNIDALLELVDILGDNIDGVSVLGTPGAEAAVMEFVEGLNP